ncbi:hypothetical protein [Rubinisphaera italica]|uniref:Uncharacterized protein n=1 Tax=Rubinisphaera italica TaxID=2527969 RepID=A0A5C5XQK3_9PLAN|nr:hypothetical protein [Rubinisphaera italica]TWT64355.1 hypothetical protein Pan54_51170 [Rubinisphaera italica]
MKTPTTFTTFFLMATVLVIAGCSDKSSTDTATSGPPNTVDAHAGHAHPSEGPHHGDLIELGNEEYHAEILHDEDAGTITIYVLNGAATEQVSIDATEVTINAKHDGKPEQFTLAASPDTNDPQGKSSRFISNDAELAHRLDEEGAEPKLVLSINGKSYRGTISHDHDHDGHDH